MRRNRKNNMKKERVIMIASSAFVLAALTMTGVYMKDRNVESKDDGYSIDYAAVEDGTDDKSQELAQNNTSNVEENMVAQGDADLNGTTVAQGDTSVAQGDTLAEGEMQQANMDDDLDYMPLEAGSSLVEIPGLTDGTIGISEQVAGLEEIDELKKIAGLEEADEQENADEDEEASTDNVVVSKELAFSEENGLVRPSTGEILMHYSMDGSIYFATLDQYKYNPAVIFAAKEGSVVSACAEGKVVEVYEDAQIGKAVTIDLGNGYEATYGQLQDIQVSVDSYVNAGDTIGSVAAPTKYFSVEGSNLYFQLTKDGEPVNPENLF